MTRADFHDWIIVKGGEVLLLPEDGLTDKRSIRYRNPKTGGQAYINGPIDETVIMHDVVCYICGRLGIEVPSEASHRKEDIDRLRNRDWGRSSEK